jgi:DNA-binding CsgD family transcriptional regulator
LSADSPPPVEPRPAGLTPREFEVLRLVALGHSDREIADACFISRYTVTKHVANILAKLGVGSRTAAAALAHRDGLI